MSSVGIFEKWMLNDVDSILMKMFEMLIPLSLSPRQRDFSAVRGLSDQTFWIYIEPRPLISNSQRVYNMYNLTSELRDSLETWETCFCFEWSDNPLQRCVLLVTV